MRRSSCWAIDSATNCASSSGLRTSLTLMCGGHAHHRRHFAGAASRCPRPSCRSRRPDGRCGSSCRRSSAGRSIWILDTPACASFFFSISRTLRSATRYLGVLALAREPLGVPVLGNAEADTDGIELYDPSIYILSQLPTTTVMWLRALQDARAAALGAGVHALHDRAFVHIRCATPSVRPRPRRGCSRRWPRPTAAPCGPGAQPSCWCSSSTALALPTGMPRTMSATRRAFCAEMRAPRRIGFGLSRSHAVPITSWLPRFSCRRMCPLKVRVTANSPSLCPTMFSLTSTGTCWRPLCTAMVKSDHFRQDHRAARPGLDRALAVGLDPPLPPS